MSISGYGKRYLDQTDFLSLCSNLEIKDIGENWLEFLEKNKILFPDIRIKLPIEYAKNIYAIYYPNANIKVPKRWKEIHRIVETINFWGSSDDVFSPFDKKEVNSPYLQFPNHSKFRKWNFSVKIKNKGQKIPWQINYFAYWKSYYLYEITNACIYKFKANSFDKNVVKHIWKKGISGQKLLGYSLPNNYERLKGDFLEKNTEFEALAFYIESFNKCNTIPFWKWKEYSQMSEEKRFEFELRREKRIAKITACKFHVDKNKSFDFLRFLCKKYIEYDSKGMKKLSSMMKEDIINQMNFIENGFNIDTKEIYGKIKRVGSFYLKNSLEYIIRGEIVKAKENMHRILGRIIGTSKINNLLLEINEEEVNMFIDFCEDNYMESLYYDLYRFEYGKWNYYSIISNLSSFIISFEGFLKILKGKINSKKISPGLKNTLEFFYSDMDWWQSLDVNWSELTSSKRDLEMQIFEIENGNYEEIVKTFLIIGVIRNNIVHSAFEISFDKKSPNFYFKKIAEAIWYVWSDSQKKLLK